LVMPRLMKWEERIGRRLSLRDLSILLTAVEIGSMSKAALSLGMTQPAISKTIAELERIMGVQLVKRTPRGIEPTPHGHALLARAQAAFQELRHGLHTLEAISDAQTGELHIAANQAVLFGMMRTVIDRIHQRSPGVTLTVTPAYSLAEQIYELEQGNVELAVGRITPQLTPSHFETTELFHGKLVVVAGPDNHWRRRSHIELSELMEEPWALPPTESVTNRSIRNAFEASGLDFPQVAVEATSIQLLSCLVMEGEFLSLLPDFVVRSIDNMITLPVKLAGGQQSVGILTLKHRAPTPLAKIFIEYAQQVKVSASAT